MEDSGLTPGRILWKHKINLSTEQIPKPGEPGKTGGAVCKNAVLGGLHHHYDRRAV
jgi:hypothetical protein